MAITVTLSEKLSTQLQAHAQRLHLSPEAVVEQVLTAALPVQEANGFHDRADVNIAEHSRQDEYSNVILAQVVAQIKAMPANSAAIEQGNKVGDKAYLQYLLEHAPTDTLTMAEWEQHWPAFEQEIKDLERAQASAEN